MDNPGPQTRTCGSAGPEIGGQLDAAAAGVAELLLDEDADFSEEPDFSDFDEEDEPDDDEPDDDDPADEDEDSEPFDELADAEVFPDSRLSVR